MKAIEVPTARVAQALSLMQLPSALAFIVVLPFFMIVLYRAPANVTVVSMLMLLIPVGFLIALLWPESETFLCP